uniref:Uncharacterized protein n=1 Tax=Stegastes partitus TaxID=144197 RepID=A0A3B5AI60_9TELE
GVGQGTSVSETPEMERVKRNQHNISTIKYKDSLGRGTAIPDLPEVQRVKQTQKHISSVVEQTSAKAKGTPVVFTPEMERVKRNQENIMFACFIYFYFRLKMSFIYLLLGHLNSQAGVL